MDGETTVSRAPVHGAELPAAGRQVALVDVLDRLLAGGVVVAGDLVLSIADVDLVRINLRAVIESITNGGVGRRETSDV